jgi:hypothetical protein
MADPKARRSGESYQEWLARLARERYAKRQLSSGRAQISDVTDPPVSPLVDVEPTVSEQVDQTVQGRGSTGEWDTSSGEWGGGLLYEPTAQPGRGLPGDNYANLLDQLGPGGVQYPGGVWPGYAGRDDVSTSDAYNIARRGMSEKGIRMPGMLDPEGEEDIPWMKGVASQVLGYLPDLAQEIMTSDKALPFVPAGSGLAQKAYEGWTGEKADKDFGKFTKPIRAGSKWWRQAFQLGEEGTTEYENWFNKATTKQTGWPWGGSAAPEEAELKLSIEGAVAAGAQRKDGTKGDVPAQRTQTPTVMEDSKSRMMLMMLGENPLESMDMAKMFEKAESDYNTAIVIGSLTGKGVGPANKFMSSFIQGAGLQYRMDNDKKMMAYNIMTTKPASYFWHDANDGIEPLMLYPWDDIPKGYVSNKPELTGQQRDRKQYTEILDEFPNDREAGLDAAMDAYIANNPQIFSIFEGFEGTPQEIMESKYEHAARWATGMFNSGKGEHYTRQERQEFAVEWAKAEASDDWQWIIKTILRKQRGWPAAYDARVRARFGEK